MNIGVDPLTKPMFIKILREDLKPTMSVNIIGNMKK